MMLGPRGWLGALELGNTQSGLYERLHQALDTRRGGGRDLIDVGKTLVQCLLCSFCNGVRETFTPDQVSKSPIGERCEFTQQIAETGCDHGPWGRGQRIQVAKDGDGRMSAKG